jgi:5-methylcytosine-specific restriction enzyme subunit McrC
MSSALKIVLTEERDCFFPEAELEEEVALALISDGRFEVDWPNPANGKQYRIRSKGWVGHFPAGNASVVVRPKVPIQNIFGMLELAYDLKSLQLFDGLTSVDGLEDIFERVASILAQRVLDRAKKGLYRAYIEHEENLPFRRGRIQVPQSVHNLALGKPQLACVFSEQTVDLFDNRILLWGLFVASRACRRKEVKDRVRLAYRALHGYVSLVPVDGVECLSRSYSRLNADYAVLHSLCRFIIDHAGPTLASGQHLFVPFCVDMPRLFEVFVARWLDHNLPPHLMVRPQVISRLKSNLPLRFEMDLVLYSRASMIKLMVLDTKYKSQEMPKEADIQQMVAYAVEAGVGKAVLVYPKAWPINATADVGDVTVVTGCYDISKDLAQSGSEFVEYILGHLPADESAMATDAA